MRPMWMGRAAVSHCRPAAVSVGRRVRAPQPPAPAGAPDQPAR
jgi:hypothetical protein